MIRRLMIVFLLFNSAGWAQRFFLYPGEDVPGIVASADAGSTFVFAPGIYRLSEPIIPKDNDRFVGQEPCSPSPLPPRHSPEDLFFNGRPFQLHSPHRPCSAILSGGVVIGPSATFDGTNYEVPDQTQQGARLAIGDCDPGWLGCIYPEDLFFDGKPLQHLYSSTLPTIGAGQWWFDYTNHIIYFHDNPAGHRVETSVVNNAFGGSANDVTIRYLTVEEFADTGTADAIGTLQGATALTQGTDWTIEDCDLTLNHTSAVRVNYQMRILRDYIHLNGELGIAGGVGGTISTPATTYANSGVVIQDNTITNNDYAHFNPGYGAGGIKINVTAGITIRDNTINDNEGCGVHFDDSSGSSLVEGNTIADNIDQCGILQEISFGPSIFRDNVVLRNGTQVYEKSFNTQISVAASTGVEAYCNVMEIPSGPGVNGWTIGDGARGDNPYPPNQLYVSTGNNFHHNTVIWDAGATGTVGEYQEDALQQPDFFADNTPPDYNTYHLPSESAMDFIYDNNNSQSNQGKTFAEYQAAGADVHGSVDTNYTSGYPAVSITSPADQSSVSKQVTINAKAWDRSGIAKVEFYVDWNLQDTVANPPYNFRWTNGTAGQHTLAAMAYSNAGIRACYAITVDLGGGAIGQVGPWNGR